VIDSWPVVSASEERLLLHQFLRFNETRAIAQHLILQQALQMLSIARPPFIPPASRPIDCSHQSQLAVLAALQYLHNSNAHSVLSSCNWFLPSRDERCVDAGNLVEDGDCGIQMATSSELNRMETGTIKDHGELPLTSELTSNCVSASRGRAHQGP